MKNTRQTLANTKVGNPFVFCSNLHNLKDTRSNSFIVGRPGKGTKTHFIIESNFKPELAPKEANIGRIQIDGNNFVVMSY
ncbi:hypothetical protein COO03_04655 [Bacillus sp. AFS098217]|uniref:hypothetical protein n=1 Tax=Bacillus sp. AFS098217 TaxID=2033868 RepID=UPI000BED0595|nr:hypothetical protein [Bacillus sp. AFS098217]PEB54538.1 hypothetical protein COO03_04655 [Bacillus sp. AFS098217]